MNKQNRKELDDLMAKIKPMLGVIEEVKSAVEDMRGDEQEKFDNMSEGLQQSERGQAIERAATDLQDIYDELEAAFSALENANQKHEELE